MYRDAGLSDQANNLGQYRCVCCLHVVWQMFKMLCCKLLICLLRPSCSASTKVWAGAFSWTNLTQYPPVLNDCVALQLQDAVSDVGSTLQKYSQKVTALVGSRSQKSTQGSDGSYEQSPSADDGSEQAADSEGPSAPSARSKASVPRSS